MEMMASVGYSRTSLEPLFLCPPVTSIVLVRRISHIETSRPEPLRSGHIQVRRRHGTVQYSALKPDPNAEENGVQRRKTHAHTLGICYILGGQCGLLMLPTCAFMTPGIDYFMQGTTLP